MSLRRIAFFAAALLAAALSRPTVALAQSDVIRGRIIGPDSVPIERATITVTSLNGNITRNARTDKAGRYQIVFPGDEGDYIVNVAALGFAAKKFEIKRTGDQEILVADARLQKSATQLDAVKVQAQRDKPIRDDTRPDVGGSERTINGASISADQLGDLAALAASLPGVQLIPGADGSPNGFSVLGLGADQNSMTLNGMPFGGGNIPRDANVSTSLSTSPYDVSRGNFSGGLLNIRTGRASNFIVRSGSANIDAPKAQWTDAAGRALHQQYANISAGGLFAGPIQSDKSFFNLSYQLGRRQSDLQSLLNTDPIGLQTAGLAPDSVRRLLGILGQAHIPQTVGAVPNSRYTDQALILGSFDVTPPSSTTGQAFNITYNASVNRSSAISMAPTDLPSHSGDRTNWSGGLQGKHTNYFGFLLSETALGVSRNKNYGSPYLDLPSGSVRVNSSFADGTPSVQTVGFGGNPNMNTSVTTTGAQFTNMLSWVSENNKHRIKFGTEFRRDQYAQDLTTNQLGTFNFNSLADLEAGKPATFIRQLSPRTRSESEYVGAFSLGDSYRPNSDVQVTVRCAPRRQPLHVGAHAQPRRRATARRVERQRAESLLSQSAPRIFVDVRRGSADRWIRWRVPRSPRDRSRRYRHVPEHAAGGVDRKCDGQYRFGQCGAAVGVRRTCGTHAGLGGVYGKQRRNPVDVRRWHHEHCVLQHGAKRVAVRQELRVAAIASVEPAVARTAARQPVQRHDRRDILIEPEPGKLVRSELQAGTAIHAGE